MSQVAATSIKRSTNTNYSHSNNKYCDHYQPQEKSPATAILKADYNNTNVNSSQRINNKYNEQKNSNSNKTVAITIVAIPTTTIKTFISNNNTNNNRRLLGNKADSTLCKVMLVVTYESVTVLVPCGCHLHQTLAHRQASLQQVFSLLKKKTYMKIDPKEPQNLGAR